jgi:hypothetical protein
MEDVYDYNFSNNRELNGVYDNVVGVNGVSITEVLRIDDDTALSLSTRWCALLHDDVIKITVRAFTNSWYKYKYKH